MTWLLRQLRRHCADTPRRVQREADRWARNFNCAAPHAIGGDCLIDPLKTAQHPLQQSTNAPPMRRYLAARFAVRRWHERASEMSERVRKDGIGRPLDITKDGKR